MRILKRLPTGPADILIMTGMIVNAIVIALILIFFVF